DKIHGFQKKFWVISAYDLLNRLTNTNENSGNYIMELFNFLSAGSRAISYIPEVPRMNLKDIEKLIIKLITSPPFKSLDFDNISLFHKQHTPVEECFSKVGCKNNKFDMKKFLNFLQQRSYLTLR